MKIAASWRSRSIAPLVQVVFVLALFFFLSQAKAQTPDFQPLRTPTPRKGHLMTYDAARRNVVLFGGEAENGSNLIDTWVWNGKTWLQKAAGANAPHPEEGTAGAMVYDSVRREVVLVTDSGATWTWDGQAWKDKTPQDEKNALPGYQHFAMAFDEARGETVLFGGCCEETEDSGETWIWNGQRWKKREVAPDAQRPSGRTQPAMAYDSLRREVVLFGGIDRKSVV